MIAKRSAQESVVLFPNAATPLGLISGPTRRAGAIVVHLCVGRRSLTPGQPRSSRVELNKNGPQRDGG